MSALRSLAPTSRVSTLDTAPTATPASAVSTSSEKRSSARLSSCFVAPLAACIALFLALVSTPAAFAHDQVIKSDPPANSVLDELPDEIELTFSGIPKEGFNTIALSKDGTVIHSGTPEADGRELSLDLPDSLEDVPGKYTVGFQITSSDGHATRGSYEFTVAGHAHAGQAGAGHNNTQHSTATQQQQNSAQEKNSAHEKGATQGKNTEQQKNTGSTQAHSESDSKKEEPEKRGLFTWLLALGSIVVLVAALAALIMRWRGLNKD